MRPERNTEPLRALSQIALSSFDRPERLLHHYTSAGSLKRIVERNVLWASAAYYLNDFSEIEYGVALTKNIIGALRRSSEQLRASYLERLLDVFEATEGKRQLELYFTAFSEKPNLLSQWRTYAAGGGVAISFDFQNYPKQTGANWGLRKIEYAPEAQTEAVETMLDNILTAIEQRSELASAVQSGNEEKNEELTGVLQLSYQALENLIVGFKHPAFCEEHEWRLVIRFTGKQSLCPQGIFRDPPVLAFREGRFSLTPHLELTPQSGRLPIKSVWIGPNGNPPLAKLSVKRFLEIHGYDDVEVKIDEAPARL